MNRSDYNEENIKKLREEVQDYIVPLCNKLYERQAKRIGIDDFWFAHESIEFKNGNATIKKGKWAIFLRNIQNSFSLTG